MSPAVTRASIAAAVVALALASAARGATWSWRLTPYLWDAGIRADVKVDDRTLEGGAASGRARLVDEVDLAGMLHFEGQAGRHGFLVDGLYLDAGGAPLTRTPTRPAGSSVTLQGDLRAFVGEVAGLYNPRGDGSGFGLLYGMRVFGLRNRVDARWSFPVAGAVERTYADGQRTYWDALVGARYLGTLGAHWRTVLRADLSGGGTELAWSANAGLGYAFSAQHAVFAGYRYLQVDLKERDQRADVETTITLDGLYLGYQYSF
jgi:opacity protein-like surface antigen